LNSGVYNLTDGYHPSFRELSNVIAVKLNKPHPRSLPLSFVKLVAKVGDLVGKNFPLNTKMVEKITADLTFDDSLARVKISWKPSSVLSSIEVE
jgi:hypothetical protein